MKKILFISFITLLFSCQPNTDNATLENALHGEWFMDSYSVFGTSNPNLTEEYILWDINTETNILTIVNYYANQGFGYPSGSYNFTYTTNTITLNNTTYDYEFIDEKLIIYDNPAADGPMMKFSTKENSCTNNPLEDLQWLKDIKFVLDVNQNANASQIIQYNYNDECVYLVDSCYSCPDNLIQIYNTAGAIICEMGGIAGVNTCPDFFETATDKRFLYNDVCTDNELFTKSLEEEYGCVNTKYQIQIDLVDDFAIIHSQAAYNDLVTGICQPEIDFNTYDLVIGKKGLTSGNDTITYQLIENCNTNNLELKVSFHQNITTEAPNLTYHALIAKLGDEQNLNVEIIQVY